jgi:hypothetical protein
MANFDLCCNGALKECFLVFNILSGDHPLVDLAKFLGIKNMKIKI